MNLDKFTRGYIDAALWSSTALGSPEEQEADPDHQGTFDSSFESCGYGIDDLSPELLASVLEDCADFQTAQAEDLTLAYERYRCLDGLTWEEYAGHDFWLTRNGHGAGFWDRGLGEVGDRLSEAAKVYGGEDWYIGDDGKIYG